MADNQVEIRILANGQEQTMRVLEGVGQAGARIGSLTSKGANEASGAMNSLRESAQRAFEVFTGVSLAGVFQQGIGAIRDYLRESVKLGAEAKVQEDAFGRLTKSVGVSGDALIGQLNRVAGGILNTSDVMVAASRALLEGLQPEQIVKVMEIARQQAKITGKDVTTAFNEMATAIVNQQERGLKGVAINIDMAQAMDKYAASLGRTAADLNEAQKTQAIYNAVVEKTAPNLKALSTETLTQAESVQKLSGQWKQFQEDLGKGMIDAGFAVADWLVGIGRSLPAIGNEVEKMKTVWVAAWKASLLAVEPVGRILADTILPVLKLGGGLATAFATGVTVAMTTIAGPLAYVASILDDLARAKWPSHRMATLAANEATALARVEAAKASQAMQDLMLGTTSAAEGQKKLAESSDMGKNALAGGSAAVKPLVVEYNSLANAMRALSDKALGQALSEDEAKLLALTAQVRNAAENTKNLGEEGKRAFIEYAENLGRSIIAAEQLAERLKGINELVKAAETAAPTQGPIGAQIQALDEAAAMFEVYGDAQALAQAQVTATETAIKAATKEYGANSDAVQNLKAELLDYKDALAEANRMTDIAAAVTKAWRGEVEEARDPVAVLVDELRAARNEALSFGGGMTDTEKRIAATEKAIRALASEFGDTDPTVANLRRELSELKALRFEETLDDIAVKANVLGPSFDALGERISATRAELVRLATESKGQLTPEVEALKTKLDTLVDVQEQRDLFENLFGSISGGIGKMIEGLQLGTRSWKDMGQMAMDVLRSVTAEIINRLIKAGLDPMFKSLAGIVSGANSLGTGGGGGNGGGGGGGGGVQDPLGEGTIGNGGGGGSIPSIPTGALNAGTWSSLIGGAQDAWAVFNFALDSGAGYMTAFGEAFTAFTDAFAGAANGFSVALAGVGAAVAVFGTIMDFVNGNTEAAIGGVAGAAVGATAGFIVGTIFPGIGNLLGALIGGALGDALGSWIGGMFGGPSQYEIKRMEALAEASEALTTVAGTYKAALSSANPAEVLAALQTGGGGAAGNSVRTELVLPSSLAQEIGLAGQQIGDRVVVQWQDVTLDQFERVIKAMQENPGLIDMVRGSGDVPYLEGDKANDIANQVMQAAQALLKGFTAMEELRDRITEGAADYEEAIRSILPPELADAVAEQANGIRDRMLAVLSSGLAPEEMQAQLEALSKELGQWQGLVSLYASNTQDIARFSGDFQTQAAGAILAIRASIEAAGEAVEDARSRAAEAVSPEETLAANAELKKALLDKFKLETDLVKGLEKHISDLLGSVGKLAYGNLTGAAVIRLGAGDSSDFNDLYASLVNMAREAPTAAERLFAVGQGIAAVIAAAPTTAGFLTNGFQIQTAGGASIPGEIWGLLVTQAEPFMTELADMLGTALSANDMEGALNLLKQQQEAIKAIAQAAVDAVNEWAQAAKEAAVKEGERLKEDANKNFDLEEKRLKDEAKLITDAAQADIERRTAEIKGIQEVAQARQEAISNEIRLIQEAAAANVKTLQAQQSGLLRAAAARAMEDANRNLGDYVADLKFDRLSPEEKLASAQDSFDRLVGAVTAAPSAEGLADVQEAAQKLLSVGGDTASVIEALERLKDITGSQSSASLEAQAAEIQGRIEKLQEEANKRIADLQRESKLVASAAAVQVNLLTKANEADQTLIKSTNDILAEDLAENERQRQRALGEIQKWVDAQVAAIEATRDAQIKIINDSVAKDLKANADKQLELMGRMIAADKAQIDEITHGMGTQAFIADRQEKIRLELVAMNTNLSSYLSRGSGLRSLTEGGGGGGVAGGGGGTGGGTGGGGGGDGGGWGVIEYDRLYTEAIRQNLGGQAWQRYEDWVTAHTPPESYPDAWTRVGSGWAPIGEGANLLANVAQYSGFATGAMRTREGLAYVHNEEAIIPAAAAEPWRASVTSLLKGEVPDHGPAFLERLAAATAAAVATTVRAPESQGGDSRDGGGGRPSVVFGPGAIVVSGVTDPTKAAEVVADKVVERLNRDGDNGNPRIKAEAVRRPVNRS